MPFHVQKSDPSLTDRIGSVVALVLLIASWAVVYVTINPADPAPRAHFAALQVRP